MKHFLLIFIILLCWPITGFAQTADAPRDQLYNLNPGLFLNSPRQYLGGMSKPELLGLYYRQCRESNVSDSLKTYNEWQCACTVSKMSEFMDHDALTKFFDESTRTNVERGRAMYLGYIPCLETTVKNLVYDTCAATPSLCACMAERTGQYVYEHGEYLIPGFTRGQYIVQNAPSDPLAFLLQSHSFISGSGDIGQNCIAAFRTQ